MRFLRNLSFVVIGALTLLLVSCLDQYDPRPNNARFQSEWKQSVAVPPKLTATGEVPVTGAAKVVDAEERFSTICANCHGPKGMGDGPGGAALNPKPRNFHDKNWQASATDERITKVITNGGASVGLSASMAPWGSVLSPEEVQALVKKNPRLRQRIIFGRGLLI